MQLRWGICGCGLISGDFVNALPFLPNDEHKVVALADVSEERAKSFAKKYDLESVQSFGSFSYEHLYENADVDVVYVGVINRFHYEIVLKALKSGKNVLCEKPMGLNVKQVKEMVNCARENNRFLMEGVWSRSFPVYKQIKQEIETGSIGQVKFLMANFGFLKTEEMIGRLLDKEGGGFLVDYGIYLILLAQFVFGAKPVKINVEGWTHELAGVDMTGALTLVYPENRIAQLLYTGDASCQCDAQIIGTKGRLTIPELCWCPTMLKKQTAGNAECQMFCYELPQKDGIQFNFPNSQGLHYEAQCVRECIMNELTECPRIPLDESIAISEILDECRRQLGVKYEADEK